MAYFPPGFAPQGGYNNPQGYAPPAGSGGGGYIPYAPPPVPIRAPAPAQNAWKSAKV